MTTQEIQSFLNSKMPVCDTWGTQSYAGTTRAAYGASQGNPAPYACLKGFHPNNPIQVSGFVLPGNSSSRHQVSSPDHIHDVAQACRISPKTIIVLLQKEQALITDDWPWTIQYTKATGYYCPDDPTRPGWCDPAYAGFFNQVYNAARQLNRYVQQPTYFNHAAGRTSYVPYQANAPSCGGTNVNIQNGATAALYNYTPYQPNSAALNNLYGTGDNCSAYGNRNFWRMFNDWFGSVRTDQPIIIDDLLNLRSSPGTSGTVLQQMLSSAVNSIECKLNAESYIIGNYSSNVWVKVISPAPGWMASNAMLLQKSNSVSAPFCDSNPIYRLYNPKSESHFWTSDVNERNNAVSNRSFSSEGIGFYSATSVTTKPVFRLYNPKSESHFWTSDVNERNNAVSRFGFKYEGIAYYSATSVTTNPVFRLYNPKTGKHFWTSDVNERNNAVSRFGFKYEGIAYYLPQ
jgi:hypothetical protein